MSLKLTRRQTLTSGLAAPALLSLPLGAQAGGHSAPAPVMSNARGFTVGDFGVTTLLSGSALREEPQGIFGMNVSKEEFDSVSAANFIPNDKAMFYFTPTVVQAGENTILFDTGLNAAGITGALATAGVAPADVTHVVLTHMHGDHIGGLMTEDTPTFANAAYITGRAEFDHWAAAGNDNFDAKVKPFAENMTFLEDGGTVAPGITAVAAFGHTPGHMNYMLDSGGQQILLMADLANHYVWSLAYPDWEVRFDMDKEAAAASRRRILSMAAAEKMPVIGYHMPFPAAGFIDTRGDGFHYVPVSYQI